MQLYQSVLVHRLGQVVIFYFDAVTIVLWTFFLSSIVASRSCHLLGFAHIWLVHSMSSFRV